MASKNLLYQIFWGLANSSCSSKSGIFIYHHMNIICLRIEICRNRYNNVVWLLESPSMHSMSTDKKLPWRKILHWQRQKQSSVKSLLSPMPNRHHILVAVRQCWEQDDCTTMALVTSRSTEVIPHDWSSSGALQIPPPQESNRTAPCRTATPWHLTCFSDLSSYFDFFSLWIRSAAIMRPSSKNVKVLHWEI